MSSMRIDIGDCSVRKAHGMGAGAMAFKTLLRVTLRQLHQKTDRSCSVHEGAGNKRRQPAALQLAKADV